MTKVLLVEDDQNLGHSLKSYLGDEGYFVEWVHNLQNARGKTTSEYDVIILDWMLPDGQGIDYLREVRKALPTKPVIMLTARTDLIDKVLGLESGASDYLTKPFEPRELLARLRVQERVANQSEDVHTDEDKVIKLGDIVIDKLKREITFRNEAIEFTKMEFDFLTLLAEHPNRAFSREEILNKVWGYENYPTTRTVDTHVLQIRQKLYEDLIETVRGVGYRLRKPDSKA
ncbi:MAG: response regulator transcription factor [Bdellovibrio sp.]